MQGNPTFPFKLERKPTQEHVTQTFSSLIFSNSLNLPTRDHLWAFVFSSAFGFGATSHSQHCCWAQRAGKWEGSAGTTNTCIDERLWTMYWELCGKEEFPEESENPFAGSYWLRIHLSLGDQNVAGKKIYAFRYWAPKPRFTQLLFWSSTYCVLNWIVFH